MRTSLSLSTLWRSVRPLHYALVHWGLAQQQKIKFITPYVELFVLNLNWHARIFKFFILKRKYIYVFYTYKYDMRNGNDAILIYWNFSINQ